MDYNIQEAQIQRLKEILFPKKTAINSRASNLTCITGKENTFLNQSYNIKSEIERLKRGIDNFIERQAHTLVTGDQPLVTPRQCLQFIREISENMENQTEEIEEAVAMLLESYPHLVTKSNNNARYFYQALKFKFLGFIVNFVRRRMVGEAFNQLKAISMAASSEIEKDQSEIKWLRRQKQRYEQIKISSAFRVWRRNSFLEQKAQLQRQIMNNTDLRLQQLVPFLSQEGKLLLKLQTQIDNGLCEILLYNQQAETLRGYIDSAESLSSVFETVQTQTENQDIVETKIKRIQFFVEHSLTKLCITKKKQIKLGCMRASHDYRKIDDMISQHYLSNREVFYGCRFTPLINKTGLCLGIIRQYYQNPTALQVNPGMTTAQQFSPCVINKIVDLIQNGIKTSHMFDQAKQKSQITEQKYYIKAISVINYLKNPKNTIEGITNNFCTLMQDVFDIEIIDEYRYEILNDMENQFQLKSRKHEGKNQQNHEKTVSALEKMLRTHTHSIMNDDSVFVRTQSNIYVIEYHGQWQMNSLQAEIITKILETKELAENHKLQQQQREKQLLELKTQEQKKVDQMQRQNEIKQLCFQICKQRELEACIKLIEGFLNRQFKEDTRKYRLLFKKKNIQDNSNQILLLEGLDNQIIITNNSSALDSIPTILLTSIKSSLQFVYQTITKPKQIKQKSLKNIFGSEVNFHIETDECMKKIIDGYLELQNDNESQLYRIIENPYEFDNFICYHDKQISKKQLTNKQLQKIIRTTSYLYVPDLMQKVPLSTIVCIRGCLGIVIEGYYYLSAETLGQLAQIYDTLLQNKQRRNKISFQVNKNRKLLIALDKIGNKYEQLYQKSLSKIKTRSKVGYISSSILKRYVRQINTQLVSYAFAKITHKQHKSHNLFYGQKLMNKLHQFYLTKMGASTLYRIHQQNQCVNKKLHRVSAIIDRKYRDNVSTCFNLLYTKSKIYRIAWFDILHQLAKKQVEDSFQAILKHSWQTMIEMQSKQTECSKLSKKNSLVCLSSHLSSSHPQFQSLIELETDDFILLNPSIKNISEPNMFSVELKESLCFPCKPENVGIRNIRWFCYQQNITDISLTDKHYLKVLSKGIQQCYRKSIDRCHSFITYLNNLIKQKEKYQMKASFQKLVSHSQQNIKHKQYEHRKQYYECTIQIQNLKLLEHQRKKQANQRDQQLKQIQGKIQQWEQKVNNSRKSIIRADVSNSKMESQQNKDKVLLGELQLRRMFIIWRKKALHQRKNMIEQKLSSNKTRLPLFAIFTALKQKRNNHLSIGLRKIRYQALSEETKLKSLQSKLLSQEKVNNKIITEKERLMTFQDQINFENDSMSISQMKSEMSIMPISFKHFEAGGNKENIQVSEEEIKKINNGAYKLNPKTLKFLKRMGKLETSNLSGDLAGNTTGNLATYKNSDNRYL